MDKLTSKKNNFVTYEDKQEDIVLQGIDAISNVLKGADTAEKLRLLLCLDKYLDPWYGYNLSYSKEIFELVQEVVVHTNEIEVKEDALHLLTAYSNTPLTILENSLDNIEPELMEQVLYAINMD